MEIGRIGADDLDGINRTKIGLKGSPTQVRKTFFPQAKKGGIIFKEGPPEDSARKLAGLLVDNGIILNIDRKAET